MIKSSWSKDSVFTELEIMRAIAEVDLLILDDLGAEGTHHGRRNYCSLSSIPDYQKAFL